MEEATGEKNLRRLPLHTVTKQPYSLYLYRIHTLVSAAAIVALLYRHIFHSHIFSLCLFLADAVLAFMWALLQGFRWRPIRRQAFPDRLEERVRSSEVTLPKLDVFICTTDPEKEPPLGTVNTALSVMAFEYPPEKLSVYVSDDGASELTLFAFMEAARFARYWLPFCRENDVDRRSPEEYFRADSAGAGDHRKEKIKHLYQEMKERITATMVKGNVDHNFLVSEKEREAISKFTAPGFTRHQHPSILQVLLESTNNDMDIVDRPMPNLIYVSREKTTSSPHHFKAGALNTLLRVSKIMTSAPIILMLDCDMISNDPRTPLQALCFLIEDADADEDVADAAHLRAPRGTTSKSFVQFPQCFRGISGSDVYGCEYKREFQVKPLGMDGAMGPVYAGSGVFFRRRVLQQDSKPSIPQDVGISSVEVLREGHKVAKATYEQGTNWGSKIGVRYGSLVEDFYTSYSLHCEGWKSSFYCPERPAFLGSAPMTLHDVLNQATRWCVGLLEVAFSVHCPLGGIKQLPLLTSMCYSYYAFWPTLCLPTIVYGVIPQVALIRRLPLFPSLHDPWIAVYLYLFVGSYAQDLMEFRQAPGWSVKAWWNEQRMWLVRGITCFPMAVFEYIMKHVLRLSSFGFNVTSKVVDDDKGKMYEMGKFDFGTDSPFVVSLGTFALVNFASLAFGLAAITTASSPLMIEEFALQLLLVGFVVVNCWPIYEAMLFRNDGGRISWTSTKLSFVFAGFMLFGSQICLLT